MICDGFRGILEARTWTNRARYEAMEMFQRSISVIKLSMLYISVWERMFVVGMGLWEGLVMICGGFRGILEARTWTNRARYEAMEVFQRSISVSRLSMLYIRVWERMFVVGMGL